nr:MAG TPA: hypothetical protein [Caudoviricetes sp.]
MKTCRHFSFLDIDNDLYIIYIHKCVYLYDI